MIKITKNFTKGKIAYKECVWHPYGSQYTPCFSQHKICCIQFKTSTISSVLPLTFRGASDRMLIRVAEQP